MKKVLIAAGNLNTGEDYQSALSRSGLQTALVWNPIQMVDFCGQNDPDVTVVDLDLAGSSMWSALQAIKGMGALANMPVVGISTAGDPTELSEAKQAGMAVVIAKEDGPESLIEALKEIMNQNEILPQMEFTSGDSPTADSPAEISMSERPKFEEVELSSNPSSLAQLKALISEIQSTTENLKSNVPEFGDDGPELFGYIEGSGGDIMTKLDEIGETSLYDHELRHDFRNMIGSVTGFAELILMESGLTPESQKGLTRLRECSRDFVELLDQQKELAEA